MEFPITFKKITLRPEHADDYEKMKLFNDSLIDEKVLIGRKVKRSIEEWKENVANAIMSQTLNKAVLLIAEKNEQIIGMAAVFQQQQKMDHFGGFGIMVAKEYRGIGLGKKLSQVSIQWAIDAISGLECIELGVAASNLTAQHLYQSLGFHTVAVLPKKMKHYGSYLDEYIMNLWVKDYKY